MIWYVIAYLVVAAVFTGVLASFDKPPRKAIDAWSSLVIGVFWFPFILVLLGLWLGGKLHDKP